MGVAEGDGSAAFGDSLELARGRCDAELCQRTGGEGLPFPTHPSTAAGVKESSPLQDVAIIFHDRSWQRKGSIQAQEEDTPSPSPSGSPVIPVRLADGSGLGWRPPAPQLCYSTTHPT